MRFATFNICSGRSLTDGRVDLVRFADAITALDADVLSLQEVDRGQPRSGGADLTEIAAEAMGAEHRVFAPSLYGTPGKRWTSAAHGPREGPAYGCALLSRTPIGDVQIFRIPAAPVAVPLWIPGTGLVVVREEPRVAISGEIRRSVVGDEASSVVTVVATHLPFVPGWNRRQLRRLVERLRTRPDPLLLLGDLNLRSGTPAKLTGYRSLVTAPTFPAPRPRFQLDHILLRGEPGSLGRIVATSTPTMTMSDHRPLVLDVEAGAE